MAEPSDASPRELDLAEPVYEQRLISEDDPVHTVEELVHITTSLATGRDVSEMLGKILSSARRLARAEAGRIYTLDRTKRSLIPVVSQNDVVEWPSSLLSPIPLYNGDEPNLSNANGFCAVTGKLVNLADIYAFTGFEFGELYRYDRITGYRTKSLMALGLRNHSDETIGVLQLINLAGASGDSPTRLPFDRAWLVRAFASQAAVALTNVRLIEENARLIQVLNTTNAELAKENRELKREIAKTSRFTSIIGSSSAMRQVFSMLEKVLDSDVTVLLTGETGTGKEVVATAIHTNSTRKGGPFVAQNCAAMPEQLLESELFGFRRGAFTGATNDKKGLLESANGGTMFLDEIGDMPIGLQAKILRVLQEGEVRPIGALESKKINVRVIAATHRDLQTMIAEGSFREDLYYRLSIFPISLPPLRERAEDIPALVDFFLKIACDTYGRTIPGFTTASFEALMRYEFPGNVRQLKNIMERAVLLCDPGAKIGLEHLPREIVDASPSGPATRIQLDGGNLKDLVQRFEAAVIEKALEDNAWNQTRAAEKLSVSRRSLVEKLSRYQLRRNG